MHLIRNIVVLDYYVNKFNKRNIKTATKVQNSSWLVINSCGRVRCLHKIDNAYLFFDHSIDFIVLYKYSTIIVSNIKFAIQPLSTNLFIYLFFRSPYLKPTV